MPIPFGPTLPALPRLGGSFSRRRSSYEEPEYQMSPTERESVLASIGRKSLGGVAAVGNLLDLPGSMARDLLAFENPFDQLLSPFSDENRVTGRQLGERVGLIGPNRKGKLDWGDVGGFGIEVLADPLTYLTMGGSALGKAGQIAKKAGMMGDLMKVTGKGMGKRVARMKGTPRQLLDVGDDTAKAAREAAWRTAGGTDDLLDQPLGGLLGYGVPFMKPMGTIGKAGGTAEKIAKGLDVAGEAVRYGKYSPIRPLAGMFGTRTLGATSKIGQQTAEEVLQRQEAGRVAAREVFAPIAREFEQRGYLSADAIARAGSLSPEDGARIAADRGRQMLRYLEGVDSTWGGDDWVKTHLDTMRSEMARILSAEGRAGVDSSALTDTLIDYFPREQFRFATSRGSWAGSKVYPTTHQFMRSRKEFLKNHPGGTEVLQDISLDTEIAHIAAESRVANRVSKEGITEIQELLKENYADRLAEKADFREIATWAASLDPRHAKLGVPAFEANPLRPFLHRLEAGEKAIAATEGTLDLLVDNIVTAGDVVLDRSARSLHDVVKAAGLSDKAKVRLLERLRGVVPDNSAFPEIPEELFERTGEKVLGAPNQSDILADVASGGMTVDEAMKALQAGDIEKLAKDAGDVLKNVYVPGDIAVDATRYVDSFQSPKAANAIVGAIDAVTNLFKTSVTAVWPAFHVRNFVSGQYRNWIGGAFSVGGVKDMHRLMRAETIKGLADKVPAFKGMTDEEATRRFGEMLFAHDVIHPQTGLAAETLGAAVADPLTGIPGAKKAGVLSPAPVGTTKLQQANPLLGMGIGATADVFLPYRIGRNVGHYVEGLNRGVPFLELLKQGSDPAVAARKVKLMQVDYSARAAADPVMRRLLPFWSFTRGSVPFVIENLMQKPGGKMGHTIQAMSMAHDPSQMTPDYIADTASVPIAGTPLEALVGKAPEGTARFATGAGLMFEDFLSFFGSGARGAGLESLSRTNPLIKGPLEWATGQSFFQKTPFGGRQLEDLDPTLGRTIANIQEMAGGPKTPHAEPFVGRGTEAVLSNLPIARALTSARTATDPRKSTLAKLLNLGTGFRITDVSPAAQDAMLQEAINNLQKKLGGRTFQKTYVSEDARKKLAPGELSQVVQMDALERLIRQRKKERLAN